MLEPLVRTFLKSQIESMGFSVVELAHCFYFFRASKKSVNPTASLYLTYPEKDSPGFKCNGHYRKGEESSEVCLAGDWEMIRQGLVKHFGRGPHRGKK